MFLPCIIEFLCCVEALFDTACTIVLEGVYDVLKEIDAFVPELVRQEFIFFTFCNFGFTDCNVVILIIAMVR